MGTKMDKVTTTKDLLMGFVENSSNQGVCLATSGDGVNWSGPTKVGETGPLAPSLAVFKDKMYLAFASNTDQYTGKEAETDSDQVRTLLICSTTDGVSWSSNTTISGQKTKYAP